MLIYLQQHEFMSLTYSCSKQQVSIGQTCPRILPLNFCPVCLFTPTTRIVRIRWEREPDCGKRFLQSSCNLPT